MKLLIETDFEVGDKAISVMNTEDKGTLTFVFKAVTITDIDIKFKQGAYSVTYKVKDEQGEVYSSVDEKTLFAKQDLKTVKKGCESVFYDFINKELK